MYCAILGFLGCPSGKEPTCQGRLDVTDVGPIPESGRSPGGGHGNPLQYSCLENPVDRAWQAADHGVPQGQTQLKWLSMHTQTVWFHLYEVQNREMQSIGVWVSVCGGRGADVEEVWGSPPGLWATGYKHRDPCEVSDALHTAQHVSMTPQWSLKMKGTSHKGLPWQHPIPPPKLGPPPRGPISFFQNTR